MGGSFLGRILSRRLCRALAALAAYLLAFQAMGLPLLVADSPRACCCAHKTEDHKCNCKACSHARAIEEGTGAIESCGSAAELAIGPQLEPFAPPARAPVALADRAQPLWARPCAPPLPPFAKVPTPPPLREA